MRNKSFLWWAAYLSLLIIFTAYVALDTFVIPKVYAVYEEESAEEETENAGDTAAVSAGNTDEEKNSEAGDEEEREAAATVTDTSYEDENISVTVTTLRKYDTDIYIADIVISSPKYLKTALAKGLFGKNVTETVSAMAEDNGAVIAVNGDFYGARSGGYVIRNGVLLRDTAVKGQEDLVIYHDGSFEIICEDDVTGEELLDKGAVQVLSFGPGLIEDGEISVDADDEVGKAMASNPRTAVGMIDSLHYVFIVSDGRTDKSSGLTLMELAEVMESLGCVSAYNLDGGGSSTMVFMGEVVNNPTTGGSRIKERSVSDIVYIG